ncbi:MAG: hypothetical protein K2X74_08300 [Acetobacteraceae bacterium]|nr:hypothetical protein [Acetobacteraceae bacterium]
MRILATTREALPFGLQHGARVRVFCLPHAGGSAMSYRPWRALAAPWLDICPIELPGRGSRIAEPPIAALEPSIDHVCGILADVGDTPFALFGHSAGARLALHCTHRMSELGGVVPIHLFVSGCDITRDHGALHRASDAALIAVLRELGGTPAAVLHHPGLMAALLPAIRADLAVAAEAARVGTPVVTCPITAVAGRADRSVTPAGVEAWATRTRGPFLVKWLPDGHFYGAASAAQLLLDMAACLHTCTALAEPPIPSAAIRPDRREGDQAPWRCGDAGIPAVTRPSPLASESL